MRLLCIGWKVVDWLTYKIRAFSLRTETPRPEHNKLLETPTGRANVTVSRKIPKVDGTWQEREEIDLPAGDTKSRPIFTVPTSSRFGRMARSVCQTRRATVMV